MSGWFQSYGFADVSDNLLVGAYPLDALDVAILERLGVERVLNLAEDSEYDPGQHEEVAAALAEAGIEEIRAGIVDHGSLEPEALEQAVQEVLGWLKTGQRVYLHCRAGWQRSAAVAAGAVAIRDGIEIDEALQSIRLRKPTAKPLPHQREDLERWWRSRQAAA